LKLKLKNLFNEKNEAIDSSNNKINSINESFLSLNITHKAISMNKSFMILLKKAGIQETDIENNLNKNLNFKQKNKNNYNKEINRINSINYDKQKEEEDKITGKKTNSIKPEASGLFKKSNSKLQEKNLNLISKKNTSQSAKQKFFLIENVNSNNNYNNINNKPVIQPMNFNSDNNLLSQNDFSKAKFNVFNDKVKYQQERLFLNSSIIENRKNVENLKISKSNFFEISQEINFKFNNTMKKQAWKEEIDKIFNLKLNFLTKEFFDNFTEDLSYSINNNNISISQSNFYPYDKNNIQKTISDYIKEIFSSTAEISVNEKFIYKGLFRYENPNVNVYTVPARKAEKLRIELYFRKISTLHGEVIEFYFNDVTYLLDKVEKEKEQNKMRSLILAKISHEFKTPLITIIYILKNYIDSLNKGKPKYAITKHKKRKIHMNRNSNSNNKQQLQQKTSFNNNQNFDYRRISTLAKNAINKEKNFNNNEIFDYRRISTLAKNAIDKEQSMKKSSTTRGKEEYFNNSRVKLPNKSSTEDRVFFMKSFLGHRKEFNLIPANTIYKDENEFIRNNDKSPRNSLDIVEETKSYISITNSNKISFTRNKNYHNFNSNTNNKDAFKENYVNNSNTKNKKLTKSIIKSKPISKHTSVLYSRRRKLSTLSDKNTSIPNYNKNNEKNLSYLKNTIDLSDYMLTLINDIVDFSMLDSNFELKYTYDSFNLHNLLKFCHRMLKILINCKGLGKNLSPILDIAENVPKFFCSDEMRLKQVILNLMSNSIKFSKRGYIRISAALVEANKIEICIEDTGIGVGESDIKKLFKDYSKVGNQEALKMNAIGTGLGLSICKKIVKKLGDCINVESIPGKKTIFFFNIINKFHEPRRSLSLMHIRNLEKDDKDGFLKITDIDESKNSPIMFHKNSFKNNNSQNNINCILMKNPKTSKFCNNYNISNEIIKTKKNQNFRHETPKNYVNEIPRFNINNSQINNRNNNKSYQSQNSKDDLKTEKIYELESFNSFNTNNNINIFNDKNNENNKNNSNAFSIVSPILNSNLAWKRPINPIHDFEAIKKIDIVTALKHNSKSMFLIIPEINIQSEDLAKEFSCGKSKKNLDNSYVTSQKYNNKNYSSLDSSVMSKNESIFIEFYDDCKSFSEETILYSPGRLACDDFDVLDRFENFESLLNENLKNNYTGELINNNNSNKNQSFMNKNISQKDTEKDSNAFKSKGNSLMNTNKTYKNSTLGQGDSIFIKSNTEYEIKNNPNNNNNNNNNKDNNNNNNARVSSLSNFYQNENILDKSQSEDFKDYFATIKKYLKSLNENKKVILIADDNEIIRKSIKKLIKKNLGKEKYYIICVSDAIEVLYLVMLDQTKKNCIKIIISDEQMTFLNGSQLFYCLQKMQGDKKINSIPFVHCSSDSGNQAFLDEKQIKYSLSKPPIRMIF